MNIKYVVMPWVVLVFGLTILTLILVLMANNNTVHPKAANSIQIDRVFENGHVTKKTIIYDTVKIDGHEYYIFQTGNNDISITHSGNCNGKHN
jgi:phage-related protein